ncbi:MAG: MFS transporter [Planctomycetota bacterium]|nr:MFS transporter [Planctomycetota bacterium]
MNAERKKSPIGVLFLTVFVDLVGFSIIFPLFPDMLEHYAGADSFFGGLIANLAELSGEQGEKRDFYTTVLFGGILGSLYSILQFLFAPMWGRLSDRIGRRPVLLMTIGGLCVSYLVWIFSGSFLLLIISRVLGGAMGGNISVATAAMADSTDEKNRAKGMGMIGMAFGLGFILGPAIGALLSSPSLNIQSWGLPGLNPFSTAAAGAFLLSLWNLSWVMRSFKESLPEEERGKAHRAGRPISPLKLFRGFDIPGVSRTNMVYFLFLVAFAGMEFTLTFLAKDRLNYTSHDMMWIFIFVGLIIALVQGGVVRRMAPKLGEKKVTLCGLILLVPGLLITGTAQTGGVFYLGLAFLAVGSALATPCLTALASLYTPSDRQGEVLGTFRSLGALSRAVGPIIACAAYWRLGSEYPYYGAAALVLLPLLLALGLPPVPGRASPEPADSGEAATGSPEAPAEEPAPEDTDAS